VIVPDPIETFGDSYQEMRIVVTEGGRRCSRESITFYTEVLGFRIRERRQVEAPPLEEVVYVELGDTVLEFLSVREPTPVSAEEWGPSDKLHPPDFRQSIPGTRRRSGSSGTALFCQYAFFHQNTVTEF
jgi:Glyoxalase/Bleomycin resistance protein/Dioxygenase superfamily.